MAIKLSRASTGENPVTKLINNIFNTTSTGKESIEILDKVLSFSKVYPFQTGSDVEQVNTLVKHLWTIYSDVAKYINDPQHIAAGILSGGGDSDSDASDEEDSDDISEDIAATISMSALLKGLRNRLDRPENAGFKVNLMTENLFSGLVRDALVAADIRGSRILAAAYGRGHDDIRSVMAPGEREKLIGSPMKQFESEAYNQSDRNKARIKHEQAWMTHPHDPKLPWSNLDPETLSIFFRKNSVFAQKLKRQYEHDDASIAKSYPEDLGGPLEEATNIMKDPDSELNKTFLPCTEYVILALKALLSTLLVDAEDNSKDRNAELLKIFDYADTHVATLRGAGGKTSVEIGASRFGDGSDDANISDSVFQDKDSEDQFSSLLAQEDGTASGQAAGLFSDSGGEDIRIIMVLCREALSELTIQDPEFSALFDFKVLESGAGGIGQINTKNIYDNLFSQVFESYTYSPNGAELLYHLYNRQGKDNIGYTSAELEELKNQLPKATRDIKLNKKSKNSELVDKLDRNSTSSKAIDVSIDVTRKVLSDVAGTFRKSITGQLMGSLSDALSPEVCRIKSNVERLISTLWGITIDSQKARPSGNTLKESSEVLPKNQAIDLYIDTVRLAFSRVNPELGVRAANGSILSTTFLFPSETADQTKSKKKYLFPDGQAYQAAIHDLLTQLGNLRGELTATTDIIEAADMLSSVLKNSFTGKQALVWNCIPDTYSNTLDALLVPQVFDRVTNQVKPLNELTAKTLAKNVANGLIKSLIQYSLATTGGERPNPNLGGGTIPPPLADEVELNTQTCILIMLHSRLEFLIAVRNLSDEVATLVHEYKPLVNHLSTRRKALLTDYSDINTPNVKKLIKLLVGAVAHKRRQYKTETDEPEPNFSAYLKDQQEQADRINKRAEASKAIKYKNWSDESW